MTRTNRIVNRIRAALIEYDVVKPTDGILFDAAVLLIFGVGRRKDLFNLARDTGISKETIRTVRDNCQRFGIWNGIEKGTWGIWIEESGEYDGFWRDLVGEYGGFLGDLVVAAGKASRRINDQGEYIYQALR